MASVGSAPGTSQKGTDKADFDEGYKNWLRSARSLLIVRDVIKPEIVSAFDTFHKYLISKNMKKGKMCGKCKTSNIVHSKSRCTLRPKCISCQNWLTEVSQNHKSITNPKYLYFKNSDITKWPSDPWEVAKFFMPKGHDKDTGPDMCDCAGLLNLLSNFDPLHQKTSQTSWKISKIRNDICHSPDMKFDGQTVEGHINGVITFIKDLMKVFSLNVSAEIKELEQLRDAGNYQVIFPGEKRLAVEIDALKERLQSLITEVHTVDKENSLSLEDVEKMLKKTEEHILCSSSKQVIDQLKPELNRCRDEIAFMKNEIGRLREESAKQDSRITKTEEDLSQQRRQTQALEQTSNTQAQKLGLLNEGFEQHEERLNTHEQIAAAQTIVMGELSSATADLQTDLEDVQKQQDELERSVTEMEETTEGHEQRISEVEEKMDIQETKLDDLSMDVQQLTENSIIIPKLDPAADREAKIIKEREWLDLDQIQIESCQQEQTPSNVNISLYKYQKELATAALNGENCIICAPTGSGKTFTAGYIFREQYFKAQREEKAYKALFIVNIHNLIKQQTDALRELFPPGMRAQVIEGIGKTDLLKDTTSSFDLVVLTAQILVNDLKSGKVSLQEFDLLIIDECHHALKKHPYNEIMNHYHLDSQRQSKLPQIVGLTASLGVGDSKSALDHYVLMCANLDCPKISHIRDAENRREFDEKNPQPVKEEIRTVPFRQKDSVSEILKKMMSEIERHTPNLTGPPDYGTQHYENWIVKHKEIAEKSDEQEVIFSCVVLKILNTSLILYEELRATDVVKKLETAFPQELRPSEPLELEKKIFKFFDQSVSQLKSSVENTKTEDNPKLLCLKNLLVELYKADQKSKGIILARTRDCVNGLLSTIKDELKSVIKADRFVGQRGSEDSMTDKQQNSTLKAFRLGWEDPKAINLLVATDVAQEGLDMPLCNFVIRYNFVSNEIGSVQSRGRARAQESKCYLIVNEGSTNFKREDENLRREREMMNALMEIDQVDNLKEMIDSAQKQIYRELENERKRQQQKQKALSPEGERFSIHCKYCKELLCLGSEMRKRGTDYIVVREDFQSKVQLVDDEEPKEFRTDILMGVMVCIASSCHRELGITKKYKQGSRPRGYGLKKSAVMIKRPDGRYNQLKKWTELPFSVQEEALDD